MQPRVDEALVPLPEPPVTEPLTTPPEPEPAASRTPPPTHPEPVPVTPAPVPPEDDNLFNTNYRPKSMGKLSIGLGATKRKAVDPGIQSATHLSPADRKSVPRVPFDPAAEVRELRIRIK